MLEDLLVAAKSAQSALAQTSSMVRNDLLTAMSERVLANQSIVLVANQTDVTTARASGLDGPRLARLELSQNKLSSLTEGLKSVAQLPDPLGRGQSWTLPNGLALQQVRVPLGVIGLIYESRPGVTLEAASIALKSGNSLLLRGGREAIHTNQVLTELWRDTLVEHGLPADAVQLIEDPDRTAARALMHLNGLDLLIPRGGASLIRTVTEQATVPVIETGVGNCHLYVDSAANLEMALHVLQDGKMGNPSVCNALETVLVHRDIKEVFLKQAATTLAPHGVVWHGDPEVAAIIPQSLVATETDWMNEYLDAQIAAKVVSGLDEAVNHINHYGSRHSESIITDDYPTGQQFLRRVDAAIVYWNASTRFSDGYQFGFGAEVGISTQKLHVRGPMGLEALTTIKTIGYGSGQTRDY